MMQSNAAKAIDEGYVWEKSYPEGMSWNIVPEPKAVFDILDQSISRFANKPAVYFQGQQWTYSQLGELVNKIAYGLQQMGVKKGTKVGMFLPNTHYFIAFYYGILKAGGTVVNYNPLYVERELVSQIEDSETDFLVTLDVAELFGKAQNVLSESRLQKIIVCSASENTTISEDSTVVLFDSLIQNDGNFTPVEIFPEQDIAVLQYTGGTTGVPKGAMLTHSNLYVNALQIANWHGSQAIPGNEKIVGAIPLFHVFAMTVVMNMALYLGMEVILVSKFEPEEFVSLLLDKKPGFVPAVPAIFNALCSYSKSKKLDLSFVKFCLSGGAPLPGDVKQAFENNTGATIGEGYGLTEASPVVTCNPICGGDIKLGSIGLPIPGTIVEIISLEDGKTVLPLGEHGEVCVIGPQVMKGYYNKEEETNNTIVNGRLHTGDVGYIDDNGYVHLVDRLKDLILVRGYNVYPTQVEEAIYMHPLVEECIVTGVPDEERGETVWAWVKLLEGKTLDEKELSAFLTDKLSPIEIPRKIVFKDTALPKTAVGKLSRKLLREQEGLA